MWEKSEWIILVVRDYVNFHMEYNIIHICIWAGIIMEWIFDGIGTEIVSIIISLIIYLICKII